jgi:23S rRNA pseudouridine1911/1915/1917 synthase
MKLSIDSEQKGQRLDVAVGAAMPLLSRAFIQKLSESGHITVDGLSVKAGYRLKLGDQVEINYDQSSLEQIPNIDLPIIYEDEDCLVINKPVGILTHTQSKFNTEPSVASFLRQHSNELSGERAGVVHRLDRATSGVIIGAKNSTALGFLQKQFSQRKAKKTYLAVVKGHLKQAEAMIDMPIERNPKAPATFRVGPRGKSATTHYQVLEEGIHNSLVELKPETGRTHQLRVHLAQIGHPIIGDPLYGQGQHGDRLFLHAQSLEITVPNRERKTFTAPTPPEFKTEAAK